MKSRVFSPTDSWFPYRTESGAAQLFCLPYAGGGASRFLPLARQLAPAIEVLPVQPPGREARLREPPARHASEIVDALLPSLLPRLDRPYAVLGYSLGALVGFELVRALAREGAPPPIGLIAAAAVPPPRRVRAEHRSRLADAELAAVIGDMGGTPSQVLQDPDLLAMVLPLMRADLTVWETYECPFDAQVNCPVAAYGGRDDPGTPANRLRHWHDATTATARLRMFDGGHFFGFEQPVAFGAAVAADLSCWLGQGRTP